jgi:hypothetical protein
MSHHIGHLFDTQINLDLIPHIFTSVNFLSIQIDWESTQSSSYDSTSYNSFGAGGLNITVGPDVRSLHVKIVRTIGSSLVPTVYEYTLRVDQLLLLNMAIQLLPKLQPILPF